MDLRQPLPAVRGGLLLDVGGDVAPGGEFDAAALWEHQERDQLRRRWAKCAARQEG